MVFSPDGKTIACAGKDDIVDLWDIPGNKVLAKWTPIPGVTSLAFSPDGKTAALAQAEGIISLREVATGKVLLFLSGHADAVIAMSFSHDGSSLASGGVDAQIRIWETASGQEVRGFRGHSGGVTALAFSANGWLLVSGSADTTALIWDVTGRLEGWQPPTISLDRQNLDELWAQLADKDAAKAYNAFWTLTTSSKMTTPFLLERMQFYVGADPQRIAQLILQLDDDNFAVREKATSELETMLKWAEPTLRQTLTKAPSLEVQRRIEKILDKPKGAIAWGQERLRLRRMIQVLEKIGTPAAVQGLEKFAQRAPDAELRRDAQASLDRLAATK
jgi:hypothetical protein